MGYRKVPPIELPGDPAVLAYIAGIIDGEGYIGVARAHSTKSVSVSHSLHVIVCNTDPRLAAWFMGAVGGGSVRRNRALSPRWKPQIQWAVTGANAERLLRAILPYLVLKRERAEIALAMRDLTAGVQTRGRILDPALVERREEMATAIQRLNRRGPVEVT